MLILYYGAIPVIADTQPGTLALDPDDVTQKRPKQQSVSRHRVTQLMTPPPPECR
jgi:hypothetical protein